MIRKAMIVAAACWVTAVPVAAQEKGSAPAPVDKIRLQHVDVRLIAPLLGATVLPTEYDLYRMRFGGNGGGFAGGYGGGFAGGPGYGWLADPNQNALLGPVTLRANGYGRGGNRGGAGLPGSGYGQPNRRGAASPGGGQPR